MQAPTATATATSSCELTALGPFNIAAIHSRGRHDVSLSPLCRSSSWRRLPLPHLQPKQLPKQQHR